MCPENTNINARLRWFCCTKKPENHCKNRDLNLRFLYHRDTSLFSPSIWNTLVSINPHLLLQAIKITLVSRVSLRSNVRMISYPYTKWLNWQGAGCVALDKYFLVADILQSFTTPSNNPIFVEHLLSDTMLGTEDADNVPTFAQLNSSHISPWLIHVSLF